MRIRYLILTSAILGILIACITIYYLDLYKIENFVKVLDGYLLFASISLGFFGTCISILATLLNTPLIKEIFGNKNYKYQFMALAVTTLISGFGSIFITVIFQMTISSLSHPMLKVVSPSIIVFLWIVALVMYLVGLFLFVSVSMLILLKSDESPKKKTIAKP